MTTREKLEENVVKHLDDGWKIVKMESGYGLLEPKDALKGPNGELQVPKNVMDSAIEFTESKKK